MKNYIALLTFSLLFLVSCATTKKKSNEIDSQLLSNSNLVYIDAKSKISTSSPEGSFNLSAKIKTGGLDSMNMSVFLPFGISAANIYLSGDDFLAYNSLENTAYKGKADREKIYEAFKMDIDFKNFIRFMRSETPGNFKDYSEAEYKSENRSRLFKNSSSGEFVEFLLLSSDLKQILQYQQKAKDGSTILNVTFGDYKNVDGFNLAQKVSLKYPEKSFEMTVDIEEITVNKTPEKSYIFTIPSSAKVVEF